MRNDIKNRRKFVIVLLLLLIIFNESIEAQRDIPRMWVSKAHSIERSLWFRFGTLVPGNKSKERILSRLSENPPGKTLSNKFPVSSFDDLIAKMEADYPSGFAGLHVYITAFKSSCPGPLNPATTANKELVLVFAPANKTGSYPEDLGNYYVISPDDKLCYNLGGADIKNCWFNNYKTEVVRGRRGLATTIDSEEKENRAADGRLSDTRSIYYIYKEFKDFIVEERKYQDENTETNPQGIKITDIEMFFGSYPDRGIGDNYYGEDPTKFKNRLIILFEFIRNGNIFYIDDASDFPGRHKKMILEKKFFGGDNGQLCPPSTNCPTDRH